MKKHSVIPVSLILLLSAAAAMAETGNPPAALPSIDLTPLFQALIGVLAALVTYKFVPWIQARTTAQQQDMLRAAVSVAVYAAEQLYGAGKGKEKLTYVIGQLAKKGYRVDKDEIEAAVRELTVRSE